MYCAGRQRGGGGPRGGDPCSGSRQPCPASGSAVRKRAAPAQVCELSKGRQRGASLRGRFPGGERAGSREACGGDCRGGRPQFPYDRPTRKRKVHDRQENSHHPAATCDGGGFGDHKDLQCPGNAGEGDAPHSAAALPGSAPHGHKGGPNRRRGDPGPGGDFPGPQGCPFPGRADGVSTVCPGGAAPAPGGEENPPDKEAGRLRVPGRFHAGGSHEPLPLRLLSGPGQVHLHPCRYQPVSGKGQPALPWPHRHLHGHPCCGLQKPAEQRAGGDIGEDTGAGLYGKRETARAVQRGEGKDERLPPGQADTQILLPGNKGGEDHGERL